MGGNFYLSGDTMSSKKTVLTVALGTAFAASLAATPAVNAATNPFAMHSLEQGYMVADTADKAAPADKPAADKKAKNTKKKKAKMKDGSCSEGNCGANMKKEGDKANTDDAPAPETKSM
jgi:uncharacterized low-complexity protein